MGLYGCVTGCRALIAQALVRVGADPEETRTAKPGPRSLSMA